MTWSPFFTDCTAEPTSTTTPAPSCPKMTGKSPSGSPPERVNSSVWQTPLALISTSTSVARGPSRSTVAISRGFPAACATAALVFMGGPPRLEPGAGSKPRRSCEQTRQTATRFDRRADQGPQVCERHAVTCVLHDERTQAWQASALSEHCAAQGPPAHSLTGRSRSVAPWHPAATHFSQQPPTSTPP